MISEDSGTAISTYTYPIKSQLGVAHFHSQASTAPLRLLDERSIFPATVSNANHAWRFSAAIDYDEAACTPP